MTDPKPEPVNELLTESTHVCGRCPEPIRGALEHPLPERPEVPEEAVMPKRIQMSRQHPWRDDNPDAVIVARPTKWGNPFVIGQWYGAAGPNGEWHREVKITDRVVAVAEYRRAIERGHPAIPSDLSPLRGHDLACWCPLPSDGEPDICHASVLLELANA